MATIYRKLDKKSIPAGAEILTRKGGKVARWVDQRGKARTAPLSECGTRVLLERPGWYIDYFDATGRRITLAGYRDKEATEARARELERNVEREKVGLPVTDRAKALVPHTEALDSWLEDLRRIGRDDEYIRNMGRLVRKMAEGCGWTTLASIRSNRVGEWLSDVRRNGLTDRKGVRKKQLPSDRTVNQYLESARAFLNWCIEHTPPYLEENPLAGIKKARKYKRVRLRRAISDPELRRLLGVSGRWHSVYRIAALTGLRKDELRQLQWRDCRLDQDRPWIQLREEATKGRRADRIPLAEGAAEDLRSLRPRDPKPLDPVFPALPSLKQFKRDLKVAGIIYRDEQGRQFDFHALRYCFCTMLAVRNVPIRTAMELMRHRDMKLTVQIYTDCGQLDLEGAVRSLPTLTADSGADTTN